MLLVRSYRTFAPLPVEELGHKAIQNLPMGGMFLWHYPHGRPHWALPSKFGLWGARTFLKFAATGANLQPPRLLSLLFSINLYCITILV